MTKEEIVSQLKAVLELSTGTQWAHHRPQSRSMNHIVSIDKDGFIEQYVAEKVVNDDDAIFIVTVKNLLPELLKTL